MKEGELNPLRMFQPIMVFRFKKKTDQLMAIDHVLVCKDMDT